MSDTSLNVLILNFQSTLDVVIGMAKRGECPADVIEAAAQFEEVIAKHLQDAEQKENLLKSVQLLKNLAAGVV